MPPIHTALAALILAANASDPTGFGAWLNSLNPMGWTAVDANEKAVVFARPAPESTYKREWARFEMRQPDDATTTGKKFQSFVVLFDVDCRERRDRMIQVTMYEGQNLTGDIADSDHAVMEWSYPNPESFEDKITTAACGR